jgi:hypothetical protein
MPSELRIYVSVIPVASRHFPFLHRDEMGTAEGSALSFLSHSRVSTVCRLSRGRSCRRYAGRTRRERSLQTWADEIASALEQGDE